MNHDPKKLNEINIAFVLITIIALLISGYARSESNQLSLFGITAHGSERDKKAINSMTNKLTSDGFLALNPQINWTKVHEDGTLINASVVIDCYAKFATFFGYGKKYKVESEMYLGYVAGIYARMYPPGEEFKMFRVGNYQIIPTPALYAEYKLNDKLSIRMTANYFINFFDLAFSF